MRSMTAPTSLGDRLTDRDESTRAFAAEDAGFDDRLEDVDALMQRLPSEPSRFVREAIMTALARMTHGAVCDHALSLLSSHDAYLRNAGVGLLRSRGSGALSRIALAFTTADRDVRKMLLDATSTVPGRDAEDVLVLGLRDADVNVRIAAVEYLGERSRPDLKGQFETLVRSEREPMLVSAALTALKQVGDAASWVILEELYFGAAQMPSFVAPQVLRLMAKWAPESAISKFFADSCSPTAATLGAWLDGVEVFHDRHVFHAIPTAHFDHLCMLLKAPTAAMPRFRLAKWLGRLDLQPGVVQALFASLDSTDPVIREGAALGLHRVGTREATVALAARLRREVHDDVRAALLGAPPRDRERSRS